MKRHLLITTAFCSLLLVGTPATDAESWIFKASTYSHDPSSGQRVHQYAPKAIPLARIDPTYMESGYRHIRSNIRAGGAAERFHRVQTWGAGEAIRPYGEWLRPFRPGATPFGPWGNPQGPWTTPFGAWANPYGLGRLPHPPWPHVPYYPPYPSPPPAPPPQP